MPELKPGELSLPQPQEGGSLIEFLAGAIPVLLLGFGALETIHWYSVRTVIDHALLQAARAGSTMHAEPDAIIQAFTQALMPLHPATRNVSQQASYARSTHHTESKLARAAWEITITSPDASAFIAQSDPELGKRLQQGFPVINNNYQQEQHERSEAQKNSAGTTVNGQTIFQANTLTLEVLYPTQPLIRGIAHMLKIFGERNGNYSRHALSHGYLPVRSKISVTMQTHPVKWPLPDSGYIQRHGDTRRGNSTFQDTTDSTCTGLWCTRGNLLNDSSETALGTFSGAGQEHTAGGTANNGHQHIEGATTTHGISDSGLAINPTLPSDPACGVSVCCF